MPLLEFVRLLGLEHPVTLTVLFIAASLLLLWRTEAMLDRGLEGTALGTLVLPYCSGLGNLVFVALMWRSEADPAEVVVNSIVNNATNLTLLLALPALIWGLAVLPSKGSNRKRARGQQANIEYRLSRLSLLLTLAAVGFFTGAVWLLGEDGELNRSDGAALVGLFLFWQCVQVFDAMKNNVRRRVELGAGFVLDLVLVAVGAWIIYESLDWLVTWLSSSQSGFFRAENLGWITGWLLVVPNALLAFFYAARGRADIVYSSQVGDGHICIPLAIGLFACVRPIPLPPMFEHGMWILLAAAALHMLCLMLLGRLPKWAAACLAGSYGWFLYVGLLS